MNVITPVCGFIVYVPISFPSGVFAGIVVSFIGCPFTMNFGGTFSSIGFVGSPGLK